MALSEWVTARLGVLPEMPDLGEGLLFVPLIPPWHVAMITTNINNRITRAIRRVVFDIDFIIHLPGGEIINFSG